ncbi:MAG: carboxypeptidase regulatory-like domain-containing protein [Gemmatimonadetes bacterium]|nr:carboxypeptidase regulatory-like domain-containing protein [Gemmatimonadota bacterium]
MDRQTASRVATSAENGRFVLCDVPSPGSVILQAGIGPDSSDRFETDVPASGFLRRDVYLGDETATAVDTGSGIQDPAPPASRVRTGRGRLVGSVIAADGGWPLPGARVGVVNGGYTQTNARGQWVLTGAPSGTRVLEVRAPGYLSVHRVVDIVDGAGPVHVTLPRLAAVLDTLRVVARSRSPLALSGFEERRRTSGAGRFLTAEDIERRRLWDTSQLFDYIPGLRRSRSETGEDVFLMASAFGEGCVPTVFINGQVFQNLAGPDLDVMIEPRHIAAMEVYRATQVPPQFQVGMSGCGSIVVWTKK